MNKQLKTLFLAWLLIFLIDSILLFLKPLVFGFAMYFLAEWLIERFE